jgi:predicted DNA-binding transcriptional regulator AlpA
MPRRIEPAGTKPTYATDTAIAAHFGVNRATIWGWVKKNNFPAPVRLSPQMSRWCWSDVLAWEASKRTGTK